MMRGEPSGWRGALSPQSSAGSAPGGSAKAPPGASSASPASSSSAASGSASSTTDTGGGGGSTAGNVTGRGRSLRFIGVVGAGGLDVVLLHQLAEVLAIDVGGARGV